MRGLDTHATGRRSVLAQPTTERLSLACHLALGGQAACLIDRAHGRHLERDVQTHILRHRASPQLTGGSAPANHAWLGESRNPPHDERHVVHPEPAWETRGCPPSEPVRAPCRHHPQGREVACGHKLNLTTGPSGLILDLVIKAGNPADSERLLAMLERHRALYGQAPRQVAADGSYASRDNLRQAKACGVRDMAFHKKGAYHPVSPFARIISAASATRAAQNIPSIKSNLANLHTHRRLWMRTSCRYQEGCSW
jgi:hypothetical protein